ncbi:MAG: hypothetical protein LBH59_09970 [Planctomycetaceae bacterium]|nr:hypothetical protein [Planctomycetaceae bacterium]
MERLFMGEAYRPYRLRYKITVIIFCLYFFRVVCVFFVTIKISRKDAQPCVPTTYFVNEVMRLLVL